MGIKEILAQKRLQKEIEEFPIERDDITDDDFWYQPKKKEINGNLFFSLYAPYIREPYKFDWFTHRDYFYIFFPDGAYVINTFETLNIELLLRTYLDFLQPKTLHEYTILCHFLNHIHLMIPKEFEDRILYLLVEARKKSLTPKL